MTPASSLDEHPDLVEKGRSCYAQFPSVGSSYSGPQAQEARADALWVVQNRWGVKRDGIEPAVRADTWRFLHDLERAVRGERFR